MSAPPHLPVWPSAVTLARASKTIELKSTTNFLNLILVSSPPARWTRRMSDLKFLKALSRYFPITSNLAIVSFQDLKMTPQDHYGSTWCGARPGWNMREHSIWLR
jgi:hypothetical protein